MPKKDKKIAVFGSNSFSGSEFANFLIKKDFEVHCFAKNKKNINLKSKKIKFYKFDINKKSDVDKALKILTKKKINLLINYISKSLVAESWVRPEVWFFTNSYSLTMFYFKLSKLKFLTKLIHFSTPEVYGDTKNKISENNFFFPTTPYALSRVTADQTISVLNKFFKMPVIITRTSNVYGERQDLYRIIPKTVKNFLDKKKIQLHGGGSSKRNFIYIDDVNEALLKIILKGKIGETYHIAGNDIISIKDLVYFIAQTLKLNPKKVTTVTKDRLGKDNLYHLNNKKIKKLGWSANISLQKGIIKMINYFRNE
jgi:dTDP-glucose 4,6-dehydratase